MKKLLCLSVILISASAWGQLQPVNPTYSGTVTANKGNFIVAPYAWSGSGIGGANANFSSYETGSITGTCSDHCVANWLFINGWAVNSSSGGTNTEVYTNLGGSNQIGGFLNLNSTLFFNASSGNTNNNFYQAGNVAATANVGDNGFTLGSLTFTASVGGASSGTLNAASTAGTYYATFSDGEVRIVTLAAGGTAATWAPALNSGTITTATFSKYNGSLFGNGISCTLTTGATYWIGCGGQETDLEIMTGASAAFVGGNSVVLLSGNAGAPLFEEPAFFVAAQSGATPTVTCAFCVGDYQGINPMSAGSSIMQFTPNGGSGSGPTISYGIDLAGLNKNNYAAAFTCTNACFDSPGFEVDGSGRILNTTAGGAVYLGADSARVYNGVEVIPATTGSPVAIQGVGVDPNILLEVLGSGTTGVQIGSATRGIAANFGADTGTPGNTDYFDFHGLAGGTNLVYVSTSGADSVISWQQRCKGVGCSWTFNPTGGAALVTMSGVSNAVNGFSLNSSASGTAPTFSASGTDTNVNLLLSGQGAGYVGVKAGLVSAGSIFGISTATGACSSNSTAVGGGFAGSFKCTGSTGASTATLTLTAAANGWSCWGRDVTTPTTVTQTGAVSTTSITLTMTSVTTNDVIQFGCVGY